MSQVKNTVYQVFEMMLEARLAWQLEGGGTVFNTGCVGPKH